MEIKLEFDSKNLNDVKIAGAIGIALSAVAENMSHESAKDSAADAEVSQDTAPESNTDETAEPVSESQEETRVPEEKPKRTRRSKKTEEAQPAQDVRGTSPDTEQPVSEAADGDTTAPGELPFDAELNEEQKSEPATPEAPTFPKMTKDEFTTINKAKRAELGLTVDGVNAGLISAFNSYCQRMSQMFHGNPKPSTLPPEELYQFADWFKTIELNPDYIPGAADEEHGNHFVSSVPSNQ